MVVALRARLVMIHDRQRERLGESVSPAQLLLGPRQQASRRREWTGQQWWVAGILEPVADGQYEIVGERICERSYETAGGESMIARPLQPKLEVWFTVVTLLALT